MEPGERIKPTDYPEEPQESLAMLKRLAESGHSLEAGRYKPVRKAFASFAAKIDDLQSHIRLGA